MTSGIGDVGGEARWHWVVAMDVYAAAELLEGECLKWTFCRFV